MCMHSVKYVLIGARRKNNLHFFIDILCALCIGTKQNKPKNPNKQKRKNPNKHIKKTTTKLCKLYLIASKIHDVVGSSFLYCLKAISQSRYLGQISHFP